MLKKSIRLMIFNKNPYEIKNERTGETYEGYIYEGLTPEGNVTRFSSKSDKIQVHDGSGYDDGLASDFVLFGSTNNAGRLRWRDYEPKKIDIGL